MLCIICQAPSSRIFVQTRRTDTRAQYCKYTYAYTHDTHTHTIYIYIYVTIHLEQRGVHISDIERTKVGLLFKICELLTSHGVDICSLHSIGFASQMTVLNGLKYVFFPTVSCSLAVWPFDVLFVEI